MFKALPLHIAAIAVLVLAFSSCGTEQTGNKTDSVKRPSSRGGEKTEVTGKYHSFQRWDNNETFLHVRPDSIITFKVLKSLDNGMKTFVAIGQWRISKDSVFEMRRITDGRTFQIKNEFPELAGTDSTNIHTLDVEATFIIRKNTLHNVLPTGVASTEQYYVKEK